MRYEKAKTNERKRNNNENVFCVYCREKYDVIQLNENCVQ